jgi:hypothetical protein
MADCAGLNMAAFKMFDPYGYLAAEDGDAVKARAIDLVVAGTKPGTLATLAGLAAGGREGDTRIEEGRLLGDASTISVAKVANVAKASDAANRGDIGEARAATHERDDPDPNAWNEGYARLDPLSPPTHVPPARWRQFVDDTRRFLDSPFCVEAIALGWGSLDLFGCNRNRPFARIDQAGLLWLLNGERVVLVTAMTAVIQTATGVRQTFYRKPSEVGRVLAWQLTPQPARFPGAGM